MTSVGRAIRRKRDQEANVSGFEVKAIGRVESPLTDLEAAPRQADEGAPEAWLVLEAGGARGASRDRGAGTR